MEREEGVSFERQLDSLTTRFVEQVGTCLDRLAELLTLYSSGEPYARCVDQIRALESECDSTYRSVTTHVSTVRADDFEIRLTGIYLHREQLLGLFTHLDEIANAAERFASDLQAIEPARVDDCLADLEEMVASTRAGVRFLEDAVPAFVRSLTDPAESLSFAETVGPARRIESHVDELRDEVIATAFEREPPTTALVYRELALLLDSLADAVEDVTDRMVLVGDDSRVTEFADDTGSE